MRGGIRYHLDGSLSPLCVKLSQLLESTFLDNLLMAAVVPVGCAFPATLFPSSQLYSIELLWLPLLGEGVISIVFWTAINSAVFPMIVTARTELDQEIHDIYMFE